jgi:hypothetical protein
MGRGGIWGRTGLCCCRGVVFFALTINIVCFRAAVLRPFTARIRTETSFPEPSIASAKSEQLVAGYRFISFPCHKSFFVTWAVSRGAGNAVLRKSISTWPS